MDGKKLLETIEKLRQVRTRDDLKAPPSKILKCEIKAGVPLTLRQYQVQGILHLLAMPRFVLGDDTGLGKTLQTIAALSYLWDKKPDLPALICTTKSAVGQWESEFERFTNGVAVFKLLGTKTKRRKIHEAFNSYSEGPKVLVMGYRTAVMDFQFLQSMTGHVMVFDEATAFKNDSAQVHQVCKHLAGSAERVWSLSATIIKNRLMEAWAIYKVTVPNLFTSKNAFMREYCITRDQPIGGGRKIKVVVGHRKHDIQAFREVIDPYFLGRPKHLVAQELPPLTTNVIECDLSKIQKEKYKEALDGLLEVNDKKTGELREREVTKLTAVTVCQQITNHPALVDVEGDSGKLDTLLELLDNDLEGEKVIIFSRFRQMVDILEGEIEAKKIKTCRITGAEDGDARVKSQKLFQDPDSKVTVCLITMAAAEGVNLQLAKAVVFYDTPWSAGDYLQIIGRMIRIGSIHDRVFSYHIVSPKTIDERVMKTLKSKMDLIESVLGKRLKQEGEAEEEIIEYGQSEIADLFDGLLEDAKGS
jgi:SNF2 family DNA or RNA helicase